MTTASAWEGFVPGKWQREVNVRDFIQRNLTPYEGDESFLAGPTDATRALWAKLVALMAEERRKGILDADTERVSSITSHAPGYLDRELERIVGLQTEKPLKRAIMPANGLRMVVGALEAYGYTMAPATKEIFLRHRKTHNDAVFDVYTDEMRAARGSGIITGLPDSYGRGRIIGDYRRVALYGVDRLSAEKAQEKTDLGVDHFESRVLRLREELSEQLRALAELRELGAAYGFDLGPPAANAREAVQWTYLGYLAAVKEQNGAAMSFGRVSSFLDVYLERDLRRGVLSEEQAQELLDHLVMKLRIVRFLRAPEYDKLFAGDPTWVTEALGGMGIDGRTLVTRTSFRFLHTVETLGPAPEPNLTVLWSERLPAAFKRYCARLSIQTSTIQYENDDLMRPRFGDDYGIACCVSAMRIGKQLQFFGARANLAKTLLYAINGCVDEKTGKQVGPMLAPIEGELLVHDEVLERFDRVLDWLAKLYVNTLNAIHFMHDKYAYERIEMALHDRDAERTLACGIAGLSVCADSLSAIKHARVKVIRNAAGVAVDYVVEGEYPAFGNNDDRVDRIACDLVERFMNKLRMQKTYRGARPTLSILTITSNVVYGEKTGATPDGRRAGEPFAPGANPMHGRDRMGALAALASVAKLPYEHAEDGISYTFSILPPALGASLDEQCKNLCALLDGYVHDEGHHINVNVFTRETLLDAMEHPEQYPQLTIRVSGYAVNFVRLGREQQLDVIHRTFHGRV
jgi:formate C-acetyltransferase